MKTKYIFYNAEGKTKQYIQNNFKNKNMDICKIT